LRFRAGCSRFCGGEGRDNLKNFFGVAREKVFVPIVNPTGEIFQPFELDPGFRTKG
jgi:hypothetical protein